MKSPARIVVRRLVLLVENTIMDTQHYNEQHEEPIGAQVARTELRAIYAKSQAPYDLSLRLREKGKAMRERMKKKGVDPLPFWVRERTLRDFEQNAKAESHQTENGHE